MMPDGNAQRAVRDAMTNTCTRAAAMTGLLLLLLVAFAAAPAVSHLPGRPAVVGKVPSVPLAGRVTDAARLLDDPTKARLNARLAEFERATQHQFVVVTVPSLGGQDVKEFTTRLANAWGIGRAKERDGIVLLVAPNERKARIAVGYGLERDLPHVFCAEVMTNAMVPRFRKGDYGGGVEAGVAAIIARFVPARPQN
jgi:uncharacterized protein